MHAYAESSPKPSGRARDFSRALLGLLPGATLFFFLHYSFSFRVSFELYLRPFLASAIDCFPLRSLFYTHARPNWRRFASSRSREWRVSSISGCITRPQIWLCRGDENSTRRVKNQVDAIPTLARDVTILRTFITFKFIQICRLSGCISSEIRNLSQFFFFWKIKLIPLTENFVIFLKTISRLVSRRTEKCQNEGVEEKRPKQQLLLQDDYVTARS